MAEGVGFEPTFAKKAKAVFKTATISHSVTPPIAKFQLLLDIMLQIGVNSVRHAIFSYRQNFIQ
jgi:hypothetical protein